ncbi:EspF repeat-containing protein [Rothia sp. HMSC061E04]|uniref:EspF repeat-containing protein n=1 Tax=Rothia sp. HMSC061E04 TaxID=1739431 RepID=UPI00114D32A8
MPARRTVPQHPRRRYLPAHHLGLQLRRAHGARHVAEHRPPAPNRPQTSRPVGAPTRRARERLQHRRAGIRPLGTRYGGRAL